MEVVGTIVFGQRIRLTVQGKASVGQSVAKATHDRAEVGLVNRMDVVRGAMMTQGDIGQFRVSVSDTNGCQDGAVVSDFYFGARLVCERE